VLAQRGADAAERVEVLEAPRARLARHRLRLRLRLRDRRRHGPCDDHPHVWQTRRGKVAYSADR